MDVFTTKKDLIAHISNIKTNKKTIGFVPTMGALHQGHLTLVSASLQQTDYTVVSIFVNPTQFNNTIDLEKYPRNLIQDLDLLKTLSKEVIVFSPKASELYGDNLESTVYDFEGLEHQMEGKFRPGHFDGVGTVLKLFFNCINPTKAFFGEKDFQQLQIVKKLVELEQLEVEIVGCPIYREKNGLAYSSRNERLTDLQRKEAKVIFEVLQNAQQDFGIKSATIIKKEVVEVFKNHKLFDLEYFEIADTKTLKELTSFNPEIQYRAFIAVFADSVRLIDNIALN